MQGHKRTAHSEQPLRESRESARNTPLFAKKTPSVCGDNDVEDVEDDDGYVYGEGGSRLISGSSASFLGNSVAADPHVVYKNLWLFIWLKTIGSFDSGAFSAALGADSGIGDMWELSMKRQGVLTSSVFLGNVIGCPLAGHLFSRYNEKRVLCGSLVIHTVFTFFFASMPYFHAALVNRFFIGLTLSFIVVYTPVWVDEFAPKNRQSVWMASHNTGVPLGIMLGYFLAVGPHMVFGSIGWNWAFFIKCLLMLPTVAYVARVDSRTINTVKTSADNEKNRAEAAAATMPQSTTAAAIPLAVPDVLEEGRHAADEDGAQPAASPATLASPSYLTVAHETMNRALRTPIGDIPGIAVAAASRTVHTAAAVPIVRRVREMVDGALRVSLSDIPGIVVKCARCFLLGFFPSVGLLVGNVVYMCSVVSLTSLYFVATGLQNFVTQYLREPPFNASMVTIMVGFGSAVVTAPVCGVITGGVLLDRIGGYKRNLRRVTLFLFAWGGLAVLFSVVCIFAGTTQSFLLVMSVVLFCGGALIPPGAGLTMASLPDHLRSTGAAFSQTVYNLLGNFAGPLVCGWVTDETGNLRYGIITLLLSSTLGVLPLLGILYVVVSGTALPNALDSGEGEGLIPGEAATALEEEEGGYEMNNVAGEAGEDGEAAALHGERSALVEAAQGGTTVELPAATREREFATFGSSASADGDTMLNSGNVCHASPVGKAAPPAALTRTSRSPPPASPLSAVFLASASQPTSPSQPHQQQQQ